MSHSRRLLFILYLVSFVGVLSAPVYSQPFVVTDTGDGDAPGTLRNVVAAATPGETITLSATLAETPFTVNLAAGKGSILIDKNLTIDGANTMTVNVPSGFAAFEVGNNVTFTLNNTDITLLTNNAVGVAANIPQALTLNGVDITGNNAASTVGVFAVGGATLDLTNVSMTGLSVGSNGAVFSTTATTNITNSSFTNNAGTVVGALRLSGQVALTDVVVTGNTASGGPGGVLYEAGSNLTINRSAFSNNQGTTAANMEVRSGNIALTNVTLGQGRATVPAYRAESSATSTFAFTTIANNQGPGISADGPVTLDAVIVYGNNFGGAQCVGGGAFSFVNPNSFNIVQDTTCGTNPLLLTADPGLTPIPAGAPQRFELAASSPALNRAAGCPPDGQDVEGNVRVLNAGTQRCDIGSDERAGANEFRAVVTASDIGTGRVSENGGSSVTINYNVNIAPVPSINATLTLTDANGECAITPATLNLTTAQQPVVISAIQDADREGVHECEITGTVSATNGTYVDGLLDSITVPAITVPVDDDDALQNPAIVFPFDVTNFTVAGPVGRLMAEGDPARNMFVSLAEPPLGEARFTFVDGATPDECVVPAAPVVLTGSNFRDVAVPISAVVDSEREGAGAHTCVIFANVTFTAPGQPDIVTTTLSVDIELAADPPQQLEFYNGAAGPDTPVSIVTLDEGGTYALGLKPLFPISAGSSETYIVQVNSTPRTGSLPPGAPQCSFSPNPVTISEATPNVVLTLTALADATEELTHGCDVTLTLLPGTSDLTVATDTLTVIINADPTANPALLIQNQVDGTDPRVTNPTLAEGGNPIDLEFTLERDALAPVTVSFAETARTPPQPSGPNQQCVLQDVNGNPISSLTLDAGNDFSGQLFIAAFDEFIAEPGPHNCTITLTRAGFPDETIFVNINDDDILRVYTLPNMDPPGVGVLEGTFTKVDYVITTLSLENFEILFQADAVQPCSLYASPNLQGATINAVTIFPAQTTASVYLYAPNNGVTEANRSCRYRAILNDADPDYTAAAGGDPDGFVPDINAVVRDDEGNPEPGPTATPVATGIALTPTPGPTDEDVEVIQTEQADAQATADAEAAATPTPIPDPYLVLAEDVDRLPVRTGPYLGASLVTIVLREGPADTFGDEQYEILAKNRDETPTVYWYFIRVNQREGWVSGRSVNVDLNGDGVFDLTPETFSEPVEGNAEGGDSFDLAQFDSIPFRGSIFDEIDGAPDLGVTVTVVRDRTLHRRPSRRAEIIGGLPTGTEASLIGRTREIDVDDWYQVRVGGVVGWIESDSNLEVPAVTVNRELVRDRVPVR